MKKILCLILALILVATFTACTSGNSSTDTSTTTGADSSTTDAGADTSADTSSDTTVDPTATSATGARVEEEVDASDEAISPIYTVLNTMEYTLYQNIFYNDQGSQYDGKEVTKEGTFATITDCYNDMTRYYVWGYNDKTKCCDWQWEIKIDDTKNLPADGSKVTVKGTFSSNDSALDGYWITDPEITVEEEYTDAPECDVNMTTMSATLERVQLQNIQNYKDKFEGKVIYLYGRILNTNSVQHPYYDEAWSQDFKVKGDAEVPAIGTCCILCGTYKSGVLENTVITPTSEY